MPVRTPVRMPVLAPVLMVVVAVTGCAAAVVGGADGRSLPKPAPAPFTVPAVPAVPRVSPVPPERGAWPGWGFTHTQYSADHGRPEAVESVRGLLGARPMLQNQHIMGWGAENPEPAPGEYDFASLDYRLEFIESSGGVPVITLCCAPDWMKGGRPGETDWSRIEEAPDPNHYDDFAALAAAVAERYPGVRYFVVWNEFKGFWDAARGRWDYEGYTRLYNLVYEALKKVNPAVRVGGPYVPMSSYSHQWRGHPSRLRGPWGVMDQRALDAFAYWLDHKRGADFAVVDGHTATDDKGLVTDEFTALGKFSAVNGWIRQRSDLPVWWAEWYVEQPGTTWTPEHRTAVLVAAMTELAEDGTAAALYWNPQRRGEYCPGCLWTSTWLPGGGQALPALSELRKFARTFPPALPLRDVSPGPEVRALAGPGRMVVVNTRNETVETTVDGRALTLDPYQIRWLSR